MKSLNISLSSAGSGRVSDQSVYIYIYTYAPGRDIDDPALLASCSVLESKRATIQKSNTSFRSRRLHSCRR